MTKIHYITVATHSEGMYNELINNKYNIKIKVLGYGKKWTGFKMKFELLNEYLKKIPDNDIIVLLDGFDTKIVRNPNNLKRDFMSLNTKILFSKDEKLGGPMTNLVFKNCYKNYVANTGLYMGYVKYIKLILNSVLNKKCKDDQVLINNKVCNKYKKWIKIDINNKIFQNNSYYNNKKTNAYFFQYASDVSFKRFYRSIFEYTQFFIVIYLILYLILSTILFRYKLYPINIILTIIFFLVILKSDWSCI